MATLDDSTDMTNTNESREATAEELREARAALAAERKRVAALSLFARRMTHDMSNFVTVVRTYSELLLADLPPAGTTFADVQEIHRAADAMIEYMHRIVKFARTGGARPGPVQLDDIVSDVLKSTTQTLRINASLGANRVVYVDSMWLADAIRELITNACEASSQSSPIELRTWSETITAPVVDCGMPIEPGNYALIEVADEGSGISSAIRADALDPFVTTKQAVRGAGFGLSVARSAAWNGGGQLVIDTPTAAKSGTRVRIWLPTSGNPETTTA